MANYTVSGNYTLPSLGKVYQYDVNPNFTIRSMTTAEEMRRLNPSERPYKVLADIIDDCFVEKPNISAYDMCIGDFQFVLHKLRTITYGSPYRLSSVCPYCGCTNEGTIDLEEMEVFTYSDELSKYFELDLPVTKKHIKLKMQTPRMLDDISVQSEELRKKSKNQIGDSAFLFTVQAVIDTVDGTKLDPIQMGDFVKNLPMGDTNHILAYSQKLNERVGLNNVLNNTCDVCGLDYTSTFRTTQEFFRPTIDI